MCWQKNWTILIGPASKKEEKVCCDLIFLVLQMIQLSEGNILLSMKTAETRDQALKLQVATAQKCMCSAFWRKLLAQVLLFLQKVQNQ